VSGPPQKRSSGNGVGTADQQVADFTGDGKADAAVYLAASGAWYVGTSTGSGFAPTAFAQWSNGHGLGSDTRLVGQANADGKADVGYFFVSPGVTDLATSSGSGFWAPTRWATGAGAASTDQFLGDANGDGYADLVTYHNVTGTWNVANSNGNNAFGFPQTWITGHGANS
jgi:hypothetical protein